VARRTPAPATELELRVELAQRRDEREQRQARALCAIDSESCRAGDEWQWFDLTQRNRTYCFCPAHALAAEIACVGTEDVYAAMTAEQLIRAIQSVEARRTTDKERAG